MERVTSGASTSPRAGLLAAVSAYLIWGAFPLYFLLLVPAGPIEIVAFRILMSLALCALLLTVVRRWGSFVAIFRDRRTALLMLAASAAIYLNWLVYIFAVLIGHVIEASLGYFINPLVTVLLGVLVLRERVRPAQVVALGFAAAAVVVIVVGYGSFPWIALVLAFTFAGYGLIKRIVGPRVDALSGLAVETAWLAPVAVVQLAIVVAGGAATFGQHGGLHTIAMLGAGVVTTVPLLLFAAGARRIPLVALGLAQFLTPVLQFLAGWLVLHEEMPFERWIGFGLVWVALVVLMTDAILHARPPRRASLERV